MAHGGHHSRSLPIYSAFDVAAPASSHIIKEVSEQANTNSNIQTSASVTLPRRQLAQIQEIACITVNQACKILNLAAYTPQRCLLTVTLSCTNSHTVV